MTRKAMWMRHCSTAVATAVLLGGFGPPSPAASERIPPPRLSDFPLSFLGTQHLPRRTGLFIERSRGTDETGALSPGNANFSRHFDPTQMKYDDGSLLILGYSTEIGHRRDILYANGYWAEGDSRRLANSGPPPLGPIGLSFTGIGLVGDRPAPWPRLLDSAGFAIGMQTFFAEQAANWTVELGHRQDLEREDWLGSTSGTALTTRAQFRLAERFLLQMDAFYAVHRRDSNGPRDGDYDDDSAALRVELRVDF